jgi:hypothetical protein
VRSGVHEAPLWQWLDERYHRTPHGGLIGRTPSEAWLAAAHALAPPVSDERMVQVLELRAERKVKKDSTSPLPLGEHAELVVGAEEVQRRFRGRKEEGVRRKTAYDALAHEVAEPFTVVSSPCRR